MYAICSKCNTSDSLFSFFGPLATSFAAETFALEYGLVKGNNDNTTCHFQSVLFLMDSRFLYPSFQGPIYGFLFPSKVTMERLLPRFLTTQQCHTRLPMFPGHAASLEMCMLIPLPKLESPCLYCDGPCPLSPVIAKIRYTIASQMKTPHFSLPT